jgi:hypothetical protein
MRVENSAIELPNFGAEVERLVSIDVVAFDWNCPKYITKRFTESEFAQR